MAMKKSIQHSSRILAYQKYSCVTSSYLVMALKAHVYHYRATSTCTMYGGPRNFYFHFRHMVGLGCLYWVSSNSLQTTRQVLITAVIERKPNLTCWCHTQYRLHQMTFLTFIKPNPTIWRKWQKKFRWRTYIVQVVVTQDYLPKLFRISNWRGK